MKDLGQNGSPRFASEAGVIPVLVLISALGLVAFLVISSSATFKDKLFSQLFPKRSSYALSEPISGPIDSIPPKVKIGNPGNNTYVKGGNITFAASASDNVAVGKVEFYVDGVLLATDTEPLYRTTWDTTPLANGSLHTLTAIAYDTSKNKTTSAPVSVTIDKVPPTVSITNPANGSVVGVSTTVTITANATDDVGVKQVNFRVNNTVLCKDTTAPYSCEWIVPATTGVSYTIFATATDKAGNTARSTVKVTPK